MALVLREDFKDLGELQPGDSWQRLDGQVITIPANAGKDRTVAKPEIVGHETRTRLDGQIVHAPIYKKV